MSVEARKEIFESLIEEAVKTQGEVNKRSAALVDLYFNNLSKDISDTIGPLDSGVAPFVVAVLELYAGGIKEKFPGISEVVEWIKQLPKMEVTTEHKKTSGRRW